MEAGWRHYLILWPKHIYHSSIQHHIPRLGPMAEAWPSWVGDVEVPCCSTARIGFSSYASWGNLLITVYSRHRPSQKQFLMPSPNYKQLWKKKSQTFLPVLTSETADQKANQCRMKKYKKWGLLLSLNRQATTDGVEQSPAQWTQKGRTWIKV